MESTPPATAMGGATALFLRRNEDAFWTSIHPYILLSHKVG